MSDTDVLDTVTTDGRVAVLRDAVRELLDGYAELARLLPSYGPPPEIEQALLAPLHTAAGNAATLLREASG